MGLLGRHFNSDDWAARIGADSSGGSDGGACPCTTVASWPGSPNIADCRRSGRTLCRTRTGADGEPEETLERIETALAEIRLTEGDGEPVALADAAVQAIVRIDEIQRRDKSAGIPTGLISFDSDQGGLFPAGLTILAARESGPSARPLSHPGGAPERRARRLVYFASLEMSAAELSIRLACGKSGVSNRVVQLVSLRATNFRRLSEALNRQSKVLLDIHDRAALTVAAIRREIRKRKSRIDAGHRGLSATGHPRRSAFPREQQVARPHRAVPQRNWREYAVPILCLCQLNRQADSDETPRLSHLRESGAIEQDADVVLFLSKHEPTDKEPHNAILTIAKNRNGETGPFHSFGTDRQRGFPARNRATPSSISTRGHRNGRSTATP